LGSNSATAVASTCQPELQRFCPLLLLRLELTSLPLSIQSNGTLIGVLLDIQFFGNLVVTVDLATVVVVERDLRLRYFPQG